MIELTDRVLLNNGISLVDDDKAMRYLLESGELPKHIKVIQSEDSELYKEKYLIDVSHKIEDDVISPDTSFDGDEYESIIWELYNTHRGGYVEELHDERFAIENDYFVRNGHQHLIVKLHTLIQRFRDDGVVWGVGRGSACASYIFYLMGVHDVDSILYDLNFQEFSKEVLEDD